jgi:hypothetical protein
LRLARSPDALAIAQWAVPALAERRLLHGQSWCGVKREQRPASPAGRVTFRPGGPSPRRPASPGRGRAPIAHRLPAGPPGYVAGPGRVPGRRHGTGAGRRTGRPTTARPAARRHDRPAGLQTGRPARQTTGLRRVIGPVQSRISVAVRGCPHTLRRQPGGGAARPRMTDASNIRHLTDVSP